MTTLVPPPAEFRPCVGIVLIDNDGRIFVGERRDTPEAWQMPQGGIDEGETPEIAAFRELAEETGITSARLLAISGTWRTYELPRALSRKAWGGRYRGQAQIWVLFRFTGEESEIDLDTEHPEFDRWKWTDRESLLSEIVAFKREVYADVIAEFAGYLA